MEKSSSIYIKNYLIRKLAVDTMVPEKIIDEVITHQFSGALDALQINKSVEISGFGKFVFNEKKAVRMMAKWKGQVVYYENMLADATEQKRKTLEAKINTAKNNVKALSPKMD